MQLTPFHGFYHHTKNIYHAYKRADGAIKHLPGKARAIDADEWDRFCSGDRLVALGLRGFTCEDYHKPANEQMVELHWAAVDIDNEHQVHLPAYRDWHEIVKGVCNDQYTIRYSKSGKGLHVLAHTDKPYPFKGTGAASLAAKALIDPLIKKLNAAGIITCVAGSPNLWVWNEGCNQYALEVGPKIHKLPENLVINRPVATTSGYIELCFDVNNQSNLGPSILLRLIGRQILKGEVRIGHENLIVLVPNRTTVNIGAVREALWEITKVQTKSQCRPDHHHEHNGFIEIDPFSISLFSSPDNTAPGEGWLFRIPLE